MSLEKIICHASIMRKGDSFQKGSFENAEKINNSCISFNMMLDMRYNITFI